MCDPTRPLPEKAVSTRHFLSFMCIVSVHVYICDSVGGFFILFMIDQFFSYIDLYISFSPCISLHLVFVGRDHTPYLVVLLHSLHIIKDLFFSYPLDCMGFSNKTGFNPVYLQYSFAK